MKNGPQTKRSQARGAATAPNHGTAIARSAGYRCFSAAILGLRCAHPRLYAVARYRGLEFQFFQVAQTLRDLGDGSW